MPHRAQARRPSTGLVPPETQRTTERARGRGTHQHDLTASRPCRPSREHSCVTGGGVVHPKVIADGAHHDRTGVDPDVASAGPCRERGARRGVRGPRVRSGAARVGERRQVTCPRSGCLPRARASAKKRSMTRLVFLGARLRGQFWGSDHLRKGRSFMRCGWRESGHEAGVYMSEMLRRGSQQKLEYGGRVAPSRRTRRRRAGAGDDGDLAGAGALRQPTR